MRPFLDAWEQKMAKVNLFVEQHKASPDSSSSSSSSSSISGDSSDDEEPVGGHRTCGVCKPSSAEG